MEIVAYYRTSTKKQNLGIEAQKQEVEKWVSRNGATIIGEYTEQESGKKNNRIELTQAIQKAKDSKAVLLVAKLDRLSRNASFLMAIRDAGIDIRACDLPKLDTMSLGILATFAQYERERISERTKAALAVRKREGGKLGNPKNFNNEGRRKGAEATKRAATGRNMVTMELMRSYREQGQTFQQIADKLNSLNHKTPRGKQFQKATVKIMLDRL